MSGKPKLKMYQYSSEFKYMRSYNTLTEVFDKYYDGKKGDLFLNKQYRELPDGTFVSWYRIGRVGLRYHTRVDNCVYCSKNARDKPFSAYNLLGQKVASYANLRVFQQLSRVPIATVISSLHKGKANGPHGNLTYKYDQKQGLPGTSPETKIQEPAKKVWSENEKSQGFQML